MPIDLFIADDHTIFRKSLKSFLETEKNYRIVGEIGDSSELISMLKKTKINVLILDISMPGPPVNYTIEEVHKIDPNIGIVILTMHEKEYFLREVLRAGANAFVLKKSGAAELINGIEIAHQKGIYVDPALKTIFSEYVAPKKKPVKRKSILTEREEEILELLALGYTHKEISEKLFVSKRTIDTHRANISKKLGLKTKADLIKYSMDKGIIKNKSK